MNMSKKSKIVTIILLVMTVFLMGAIFYIGYILTANSDKTPSITPQQIKAQSGSYNKFVALGTNNGVTSPTPKPSNIISPTDKLTPTVAPTQTVLAYQNPTPTFSATISTTLTPTVTSTITPQTTVTVTITPTKAAMLPQTGFITNTIILFGVSALVMFISFIF